MFRKYQSHSHECIQTLGRAIQLLTPTAYEQIRSYISSQLTSRGGFANRKGEVDLYYTVFGLSCLFILKVDFPLDRLEKFLAGFVVEDLSMVDLSCYLKCQTMAHVLKNEKLSDAVIERCLSAIEKFKTPNGSFSYDGKGIGFPYAAFLGINLYQDLGLDVPSKEKLLSSVDAYRTKNGAFCNPSSSDEPMLMSTVAAINVIRHLTGAVDQLSIQWVTQQYNNVGGFYAAHNSQLPDMLSTSVALFTLSMCGVSLDDWRKNVRQFIDDHWDDCGGFRATILDDLCDCEYTYYGLLALGSIQ